MFRKGLIIPIFMRAEGAEELEKLGIELESNIGEVKDVVIWRVNDHYPHEEGGERGTIFTTGGHYYFSPLDPYEFKDRVEEHIERYGQVY